MNTIKNTGMLVIVAVVALSGSLLQAEPEYYTWVDENGITNYAERMPKGYDGKAIGPSQANAEDTLDAGRPGRLAVVAESPEPQESEKEEEKEQAPVVDPDALIAEERARFEQQLAKERSFNCDVGKKNLAQLEAFRRIRIKDEDSGELRFMSPEEMAEKKTESRRLITENCSG